MKLSLFQGGILSPLSLNATNMSSGSPASHGIKHQPYLDGVFGDSSILSYSDGQPVSMHAISIGGQEQPHQQLIHIPSSHHLSQSRLSMNERAGNGYSSASPRSSSGGESCSRESTSSTSRRMRQETVSQREERLRKNAERGKMRRQEESEDQRLRRLARNAERGKLRRMEESMDKREERLKKNAERQKARRNKETPEERQLRLWKNAERQRIRRSTMSGGSEEILDEDGTMMVKEEYLEFTTHDSLM